MCSPSFLPSRRPSLQPSSQRERERPLVAARTILAYQGEAGILSVTDGIYACFSHLEDLGSLPSTLYAEATVLAAWEHVAGAERLKLAGRGVTGRAYEPLLRGSA